MSLRLKGYRKYFLRLLFSFLVIVLIPVGTMGVIWYGMVMRQEKDAFLRNERNRALEVSMAIEREISGIESGLAILHLDIADQRYNAADQVRGMSLMSKSLAKFIKDYRVLFSVYFLDSATGRLLSTASGCYDFSDFYDTEWFVPTAAQLYSRRLAPRYNYDRAFIEKIRNTGMEAVFPYRKVMTVVTADPSGDYLTANVNIESLYRLIAKSYGLNEKSERLFLIGEGDEILYGPDNDLIGSAFAAPVERSGSRDPQVAYRDGTVYFIAPLEYPNLYCAISYPEGDMYAVSKGYGRYIVGICSFLILLLFLVSRIMANRLYKPIESLCSEIRRSPSASGFDGREGEIETLRHVFKEMNAICVTAEQREAEHRAVMLQSSFRMLIDGLVTEGNFLAGNAEFFRGAEGRRFQILMCKFRDRPEAADAREFGLFFVRFCELMANYLQAVTKGVFTPVQSDSFAMLYSCATAEDLDGLRNLLVKAIRDLAERETYLASSGAFGVGDGIGDELASCRNRIRDAAFFGAGETILADGGERRSSGFSPAEERAYAGSLCDAVASGNAELAKERLAALRRDLVASGDAELATGACGRVLEFLDGKFGIAEALKRDVCRECAEAPTLAGKLDLIDGALASMIESSRLGASMGDYYCEEAKRYLRENYMRYMNVTDVADFLGISYPYLCKVFKTQREGNGKLGEYLNAIRIEKSKEILASTNESLQFVAKKVGYGNVQSFQRFFKKYERMTPGDYRKLHILSHSDR